MFLFIWHGVLYRVRERDDVKWLAISGAEGIF